MNRDEALKIVGELRSYNFNDETCDQAILVLYNYAKDQNLDNKLNTSLNNALVEANKQIDSLKQTFKEKTAGMSVLVDDKSLLQVKNEQLKEKLEKTASELGYLTQHLLTVEEWHPEYLEDVKNNMI